MSMLSVVPRAVQVSASGGTVVHRLINSSGAYLAFKIKSTNKKDYRLRPVYGVIGPQGSYCINVQRLPGAASEDVFVVQYAEVGHDCRDPRKPFQAEAQSAEIIVLVHAI